MKTTSIFFCILLAITANLFATAKAQVNVNDSLALVDFYNSTNGPHWLDNTNWLTTNPVSIWFGVKVADNRVAGLYLFNNNLSGTIPASIGNLEMLGSLDLRVNHNITGSIPASIGNLKNLNIFYLSTNRLSGTIPASIGNCTNLAYVDFGGNQLSGAIPAEISNCTNLIHLKLGGNQLSGTIPSSISNCTKLYYLWLDHNKLSGTIPHEIGNLINLNWLELSHNQLSGAIPHEIGNLVNLNSLYLRKNHLNSTIPAEIANLENLQLFDASFNQLSGSIPASFRKFQHHKYSLQIDLYHNHLSQYGNIHFPAETNRILYGRLGDNFFTFDGLEFIATTFPKFRYTPQANISIHQNGNTLSVYAGGTLSNNTYNWHHVGTTDSATVVSDSIFTPSQSGKYYVTVKNKVATKLTLYSDTIDFTLSPLKQTNLIAKAVQPAMIIKHMQVYPNPAKAVVHVQVKGTAVIAISNADGKVLLTKSINNSDVINVSSLAPGTYYLQNKASGETQKIVVMH